MSSGSLTPQTSGSQRGTSHSLHPEFLHDCLIFSLVASECGTPLLGDECVS